MGEKLNKNPGKLSNCSQPKLCPNDLSKTIRCAGVLRLSLDKNQLIFCTISLHETIFESDISSMYLIEIYSYL